jgi:hypothetical protein
MCNAVAAWGSAMFTMVASNTTISCAMPMTIRANHRLGSSSLTDPDFCTSVVELDIT